jgi:hypothetical protein
VPLVDFCSCVDPQAQPRPLQTPPLVRGGSSHRTVSSADSEESPPAGHSQFRGHADALTPPSPPRRPPASTWIYPKPFDPDTFCRSLMPPAAWKTPAGDDWPDTSPSDDSFRNPRRICSPGSPRPPCRGRDAPFRAAAHGCSRKQPQPAAPKVPSAPATSLTTDDSFPAADPG